MDEAVGLRARCRRLCTALAQVRTASDQVHGLGPGATMSNSATKIAVSSRWDDRLAPFSGQDHVTVSSRARVQARVVHGTITVTTTPVPATRNRVRRLPLADAPGGEGPSVEGPSDGPPRRRQRTLHSFVVSSPASSTRSETMTERRVTRSYYVNESGEILSSAGSATSEAD